MGFCHQKVESISLWNNILHHATSRHNATTSFPNITLGLPIYFMAFITGLVYSSNLGRFKHEGVYYSLIVGSAMIFCYILQMFIHRRPCGSPDALWNCSQSSPIQYIQSFMVKIVFTIQLQIIVILILIQIMLMYQSVKSK